MRVSPRQALISHLIQVKIIDIDGAWQCDKIIPWIFSDTHIVSITAPIPKNNRPQYWIHVQSAPLERTEKDVIHVLSNTLALQVKLYRSMTWPLNSHTWSSLEGIKSWIRSRVVFWRKKGLRSFFQLEVVIVLVFLHLLQSLPSLNKICKPTESGYH